MWVNAKDCINNTIANLYAVSIKQTPKQDKKLQNKTSKVKTKLEKERTTKNQQENWSIEWENSQEENKDKLNVPSHFQKYTVEN